MRKFISDHGVVLGIVVIKLVLAYIAYLAFG